MSLDVLVIGGGNAALSAALMAREAGASVMVLESAPREWRGGNSMHTRNLRCMHDAPQDVLVEAYPEEEFWQDLLKVTGGLNGRAHGAFGHSSLPPLPAVDGQAWRAFSALFVWRTAHRAHQCVFHGRW
jgi:tricarballylate dehydrogenase